MAERDEVIVLDEFPRLATWRWWGYSPDPLHLSDSRRVDQTVNGDPAFVVTRDRYIHGWAFVGCSLAGAGLALWFVLTMPFGTTTMIIVAIAACAPMALVLVLGICTIRARDVIVWESSRNRFICEMRPGFGRTIRFVAVDATIQARQESPLKHATFGSSTYADAAPRPSMRLTAIGARTSDAKMFLQWTMSCALVNAETREECEAYIAELPEPFRALYKPEDTAERASSAL
jgi:hypothetical protein